MSIKVWKEKILIPTYEIGKAEKNPMFLEKRVYQGSSGAVYPHPVVEKISDVKKDKEWNACFLENDYLQIMILPELGGRIQRAYDKVKKRDFVYHNEVIKPALVGLTGPWISGGIEFNWPQHHRPSTYEPVDYSIEVNDDESVTVWCSEIERMFRTKGMTGFTLYKDKAYLEIKVKLYNRTSQPQTFLWWANPAVAVNDHYKSVFPPDVNAVFDHGKRDVSEFPIAKGEYYKVDYSPGTDISLYKNIPVPTSYMAIHSDYNFVGGYENDTKAGLLHIANHHVSPGKKQWTWGHGDFGQAWDRNLTDKNGPYIELMCGVYTDNQPDFSWLMPYEEKAFTQYFMPYQNVGVVKNASKDILINLMIDRGKANIIVYSTGRFVDVTLKLETEEKVFYEDITNLEIASTYKKEIKIDPTLKKYEYKLLVLSNKGKILIEWGYPPKKNEAIPEPAKAALSPEKIKNNETLYLNGLHIEQYRHATYNSTDYFNEALKRNPNDIRCNNAMGLWYFRRGKFKKAESHFRIAYKTQIQRNPNPYNGEALFNLGLSLRLQDRDNEAYKYFYKSVWNAAYMDSGYFQIAQIETTNQELISALDNVERSLVRNWHNHKARLLKTSILRHIGKDKKAKKWIDKSLKLDKFNFGLYYEKYLLGNNKSLDILKKLMRGNIHNYIEIALDYSAAGLYKEAINFLDICINENKANYPMVFYFKAWFLSKINKPKESIENISKAEKCSPDYCFPHRIEAVPTLQYAIKVNPNVGKALYYLGNYWYNAKQYKNALECWEKSKETQNNFPTVHRNLALAYYNKYDDEQKALALLEKAFELDNNDARVLMELAQLYKRGNKPLNFRLELLEKHFVLVEKRDDLYVEFINLLILLKKYNRAYDMLMKRKFHPWEGGEGKVTGAYVQSILGIVEEKISVNKYKEALALLKKAKIFPENLGEGKLQDAQENEIDYWIGCIYNKLGDDKKAEKSWLESSKGLSEPIVAWFYNDQQPDTIFYQGLSLIQLNKNDEANTRFEKLINYGKNHIDDNVKIDYFAVSLPDLTVWDENLQDRNKLNCYYLMALGYKGIGSEEQAKECFNKVLEIDNSHLGAIINIDKRVVL